MNIILPKNEDDIRQMVTSLSKYKAVGFDTETTALFPHDGRLRLMQFSDGENVYILDYFRLGNAVNLIIEPLLSNPDIIKIGHNVKFDASWILHSLGCELTGIFDTMLAAQLTNFTRAKGAYKLDSVLRKYCGIEVDKEEQLSDWSRNELTESQIHYAATDTLYLTKLRESLVERIRQDDQINIAALEFALAPIMGKIEYTGIPIDTKMYHSLCKGIEEKRNEAYIKLVTQLNNAMGVATEIKVATQGGLFNNDKDIDYSNHVNVNSWQQLIEAYSKMGIHLPNTSKATVDAMIGEYPQLGLLKTYKQYEKLRGTYGHSFLEVVHPITGRIHPNFFQMGAETGRYSCQSPNVQQIPKEKEFRECFRPTDDSRCMVVADYSQIELRILAHLSKDINMMRAFNEGIDLHSMTAQSAFNLDCDVSEVKDKYPEDRFNAKGLNFGVVYGIGAKKYAANNKISQIKAKQAIDAFYKKYFGVSRWLDNIQRIGVTKRYVTTLGGRKIKLHFDPKDEDIIWKVKRKCRNFPIQGSSSDIIKTAVVYVNKALQGYDASIVNIVHDELVLESSKKDAPEAALIVEREMKKAAEKFIDSVPIECPADIGESWADKK